MAPCCVLQVRQRGEKFEVVFVSSDKDREDYDLLSEDMPWWRIDYEDYVTLVSCAWRRSVTPSPCPPLRSRSVPRFVSPSPQTRYSGIHVLG